MGFSHVLINLTNLTSDTRKFPRLSGIIFFAPPLFFSKNIGVKNRAKLFHFTTKITNFVAIFILPKNYVVISHPCLARRVYRTA